MFRNSAWIFCAILLCCGNICLGDSGTFSHRVDNPDHVSSNSGSTEPRAFNQPTETSNETTDKSTSTEHTSTSKTEITTPKTEATTTPSTTTATTKVTTPVPRTTVPASTSPTPTASSSTHTPSKTTSSPAPPSSTTPIPVTPTPGPQKGSWNVTDSETNITCIRIDGTFSIDHDYVFNKTNQKLHLDVPRWAQATGNCKGNIKLEWRNGSHVNFLEFIFKKNVTKKDSANYVLATFYGEVFVPKLNETDSFNTNNNETHFETPVNQSYSCAAMKQIKVDDHTKVILEDFHLQAFKTSNTTNFDASVDCAGNHPGTPDIVPIVVGCVLALLVIAVLVAYLISRRRSATRGYLSM